MPDNSFLGVLNVQDPFSITNPDNDSTLRISFSPLEGIAPGFVIYNLAQPDSGIFFWEALGNISIFSGNDGIVLGNLFFASDGSFVFATKDANPNTSILNIYPFSTVTHAAGAFTFFNEIPGQEFILDEFGGFDFRLANTGGIMINGHLLFNSDSWLYDETGVVVIDTQSHTFYDSGGANVFLLSDGMTMLNGLTVAAGGLYSHDGSAGITGTMTTASLAGKTMTFKDGIITGFA